MLLIGVEVLMLAVLVSNSIRLLHGAMANQARLQAEQYHPVLEAALAVPLAQQDYATVQTILDESRTAGGVDYIVVEDLSGKQVGSSGWPAGKPLPEPSKELLRFYTKNEPTYDVVIPSSTHNQAVGTLHFGLNVSLIAAAQQKLLTQGISISVAGIFISSLIMLLIGFWLTTKLKLLTRASRQVAAGNLLPAPVPEGNDDVGQLGMAFNIMSRTISERVIELTAAKEAAETSERAKAQHEERLNLALAGADLGLWDWDLISDRVTYSEQWAGILGYAVDELEQSVSTWESMIHPDDVSLVRFTLQRHLAGFTPMYETEHRCRSKSGEWLWILDRGRVVERTPDGTPIRAAGTHLDITSLKQAEDKLRRLNEGLEQRVELELRRNREKDSLLLQQDKMASIGQLAAGVAHEINNPMGFIISNLGTLKGYVENLDQFTSLLQTIIARDCTEDDQRMVCEMSQKLDITYILQDIGTLIAESSEGAERVKQIVQDLKNFARADEKTFNTVNLNKCVESTLNMVRNEIKYVADIDLQLGELPRIVCSDSQINQVIANLLVNAVHAIDRHGTIKVVTRQDGKYVVLEVSDTGRGMTESVIKRIFEPFFTTKEVGKGTGLGLTISYDIIKKHDGEITVLSEPGNGTTFTIRLPVNGPGELNAQPTG